MLGPQSSSFVMYDEEFKRINVVIEKLLRDGFRHRGAAACHARE